MSIKTLVEATRDGSDEELHIKAKKTLIDLTKEDAFADEKPAAKKQDGGKTKPVPAKDKTGFTTHSSGSSISEFND